MDEQVDAFFVAQSDVQVAVAVEVYSQELRADARVAGGGDFVTCEFGRLPFRSFDFVPEHSGRVPGSRIAAVVSVKSFARHDVFLAVSVDVDIFHRVRL